MVIDRDNLAQHTNMWMRRKPGFCVMLSTRSLLTDVSGPILALVNRIDRIFDRASGRSGKALMPFITAGDPDLDTTALLLPALESAGASIVELGIPFSDPIADGSVIQASMMHALDTGIHVDQIFERVAEVRSRIEIGLVAMVSYSIVHRIGSASFIRDATAAGFDGFIFPDLPLDESNLIRDLVADTGGILSMLIAPTTPEDRAGRIAKASSGFIYVLSRVGVTGERTQLPTGLYGRLSRLRASTDKPLAVGFGISNPQQVAQVAEVADAVIVGSALMRQVDDNRKKGPDAIVQSVTTLTRQLADGLHGTTDSHAVT